MTKGILGYSLHSQDLLTIKLVDLIPTLKPTTKIEHLQQKQKDNLNSHTEHIRQHTLKKDQYFCSFGKMALDPQQQTQMMMRMKNSGLVSYSTSPMIGDDEDELSKSALLAFKVKEEEIKKKKMEVREKVHAHLGRVEEETKKLAEIRGELEALEDPRRKEVTSVRKRIDVVNKELKPLGQSCYKKEKEYREVLEAFNEKNKEKAQLVARLMELVSESERVRMKKLEELNKNIEYLGQQAPR